MIWIIVQILLVAAAIGMLLYYLRGPLLGMIVTFVAKMVLKKTFKQFKLGSLNLLPFSMLDFSVTLHATRKTPEITISWTSFRILMDITKIFDPLLSLLNVLDGKVDEHAQPRVRMLSFVFEGFKASSPDFNFALFLDPPANKVAVPEGPLDANGDTILPNHQEQSVVSYMLIMKRLSQHMILFVDIIFRDFSFNFTFPPHECQMIGSATIMTISFPRWPVGSTHTVSMLNQIEGGEIEILQRHTRAIYYVGRLARLSVDMHLPTGVMDVMFRVLGRDYDRMYVSIAPLLEFYRNYSHAEDNSIEIRLARGLPLGGKMTMNMECEYIDVHLSDNRCADPLHMTIQELAAGLKTYSLTRGNERLYKGKLEDPSTSNGNGGASGASTAQNMFHYFMRDRGAEPIIMSPNKEKVMKGSVKRLDFHTREESSIAYVEEATGLKVKRVFNEGNFVDDDRMDGYAKCVYFEKIHTYLLDWLIVLQDTANRLPDSRFAHKKNSEMYFHGIDILFSTQPVSFAYIAPLVPGSKEEQNQPNFVSDPPLETLDVIPVDDNHWMCIKFSNLEAKRELPFGEHDALIDVKSTLFKMETSLPQVGLLNLYSLTAVGDYDVSDAASSGSGQSSCEDVEELFYELGEATPGRTGTGTGLLEPYETDSDSDEEDTDAMNDKEGVTSSKSVQPFSLQSPAVSNVPPAVSSPRNKDVSQQQSPEMESQSRASTGTRWTFPSFSVRLKLGLKMNLEWAQATSMTVEFANSIASDVVNYRPTRLPIHYDPLMHASKLYVLWSGPSFTTDLGKMNLKASVAGLMKAQTGFNMIMKTSNRMNARMLYMKLRGWGPIAHPVPPEVPVSNAPPPPPRTTVVFSEMEVDVPVEISADDHDKRLQHELARQQKEFLWAQQQLERKRALRKSTLGSNVSDAGDLGNDTIPLPETLHAGVNRADKGIRFTITGMTAAMSSVDMAISFDTCRATLNGYPERPWMDMKTFQYTKSIVPLVEEDAFYQGLDLQRSIEAASITTKTAMDVSFDSFEMYLSARMELSLALDALLLQSSAFGVANKPPPRRRLVGQQAMEEERSPSNASPFSPSSPFGDDQSVYEERPEPSIRGFSMRYEEEVEEEESLPEDPNMEILKPNPSCMHVQFRSFAINYDAHFNRDYIEDFLRVEYLGIDMTLDSTKLPSVVQDEITTLDLGTEGADEDFGHLEVLRSSGLTPKCTAATHPSRLLVYTGIFGGQLKFSTKFFKVAFKTSKEPFVEMEDLCFTGPIYNASVKDDRVPKGEYLVALSDSVLTYAFEGAVGESADDIPVTAEEAEHSPMHTVMPASIMGSTEPLYAVVTKSAAPGKIYMDLVMSGTAMDVAMSANTMECVAAVNAVMDCVMPPVKDPSPHLMLWDTLRYLTHGSFAFKFDKMSVNYSAQDYMTQRVKLRVSMERPRWYMDKSSFSFTAQNIGVEAELITALLGGRRGRIKRASGKSAQATEISKLCSIPALVLSLNHFREDIRAKFANHSASDSDPASAASSSNNIPNFTPLSSKAAPPPTDNTESSISHAEYSHHDVYLNPAYNLPHSGAPPPGGVLEDIQYLKGDKFFHFRSQIMTSRWEVEMRLADHDDLPICFNFRLDHLSRIMDAFKPAPVDRFAVPEELEGCLDQTSDYFYGAMRPLTHMAMGDMISVLKLQMIINRVMISSWSSSTNLGGIVMNIANTDMQLRLLRDIPEELSAPKKPEPEKSNSRRRTVRTTLPDDDQTDKTHVLVAFPLKIDHLFMDTAFLELYVRDWRMRGTGTPLDKRNPNFRASLAHALQFDVDNADEPKKFEEIQSLFVPIYKNAHATKMVISLTESGVVCTRDNQFTPSGIMDKSTERLQKISQSAFSSKQQSGRTSRRFNAQAALLAAAAAEMENKGAFLIGKEWKEHLVRAMATAQAEKSSNNLRQFATTPLAAQGGRRPSALSMMIASSKLGAVLVSPNANRMSLMRTADSSSSARESRKGRRRSVQSARFSRPHADSIVSTGNESNSFPFHPSLPQGTRPVGNLRNRRSSIRSMKVDRTPVHQAAWDPLVDGYRASLLSFVTNHSAFSPPPSALPTSYVLNSAGFVQGKTAQQASMLQQSEEESSFGSKIWGLKITDMRFLFTIEIRDILFLYVARGIELFQEGPPEAAAAPEGYARRRPSSVERKKEKDVRSGDRKATIYDFLQYPDKEMQKTAQKGSGKSATRKSTKTTTNERDKFGFSPLRTDMPVNLNDPMLQLLAMRNERPSGSPRNGELSLGQLVDATATKPVTPRSVNSKVVYQKGGRTLARNNNVPIQYAHEDGEEAEEPPPVKKISARDASEESGSDEDEQVNKSSSKNNSAKAVPEAMVPVAGAVPPPPPSPPSPPRIGSDPNNMPKVTSYNSLYLGAPAPPMGQDGMKNRSGSAIFSSANAVPVGVSPKNADKTKKKKPLSEFFFLIELIDPQVNFLDVKTHSSLIIVAGRSSVEGKRYTDATLPPRHDIANGGDGRSSMAGGHAEPKRQQEVRLRMDGVSAFTVPSNSSTDPTDETDSVYWKHMESTQCIDHGELGFYGKRGQGTPATPESPFMRMAIKDFQIRALYIFWTDVTVKEARTMHLNPSKEDLVGTFKLELPVICVDICSWQFYVIMHVVRNVLLVPPPATASRAQQTQSEVEEAEKNKVLELMRDPVLLAKHDVRANLNVPLDMKNKTARDELKLLIEGNLAGAMMNMELGSARFVEVFVGSCTWILRSNGTGTDKPTTESGNNLRDWEKEQLKVELTGAHATFSYNEDRSASSLFEVQRFWIKDMDPARDAIALTKTHGTGLFRKYSSSDVHVRGEEAKVDSIVMMPILSQTEHCARCGAAFLLEENHATACTFHANRDGDPGEYKDLVVTDHLSGVQNTFKAWTCCGRHHAFAPGCSARPHTCKEVMLQIRAETNPTTRVENIDLSILKSVDISIFPNSTYDLQVHVTKSLVDVLHKYFSIDDVENYEITAVVAEPPPEPEKRPKGWKRVKKVGKLLLPKKNKSSNVEDDGEGNVDDLQSPNSDKSFFNSPEPGSPMRSPHASERSVSPTTPRMNKSILSSSWFTRSASPSKRSTSVNHRDRAANEAGDDIMAASSHSSSNSSLRLLSYVPSLNMGRLFSKRSETSESGSVSASGHTETTLHSSMEDSQTSSQLRSFNMMRKRANTVGNNNPNEKSERRSISDGVNLSNSSDAMDKQIATMALANRRQEGLYVKFLRLGGIQIEVSTQGFILNLTRFKAQMDEFRCQGEVLQWSTLIGNMERHLAMSLLANAASNSLSRFTHMFRFPGQRDVEFTGSTDENSLEPSNKKSAFVIWEGAQDVHTATSMKRSALGLPPSKGKATVSQLKSASSDANDA